MITYVNIVISYLKVINYIFICYKKEYYAMVNNLESVDMRTR